MSRLAAAVAVMGLVGCCPCKWQTTVAPQAAVAPRAAVVEPAAAVHKPLAEPPALDTPGLTVRIETGARVDVNAVAADGRRFAGAQVVGERVVFTVPHAWFNDVRGHRGTNSGVDPIPNELRIVMQVSRDGVFQCGATAPEPAAVLAMFVDAVAGTEGAHDFAYPRFTAQELAQNGLSAAIARAYWLCVKHGHAAGGAAPGAGLLRQPCQVLNELGAPITVLRAMVCYDCLQFDRGLSQDMYRFWCPAPEGASGSGVRSSRSFALAYDGAQATAVVLYALNDNGVDCQAMMDGQVLVDESRTGSRLGRKIRLNSQPGRVKLVVNNPWSFNFAYAIVAQLGGRLDVAHWRETVDGKVNPPTAHDRNPAPMALVVPTGWSEWSPGAPERRKPTPLAMAF